jgi:hypothetical protein
MQILGTHMLFYSADPSADRAFLRDVLGFKYVETHPGWLIFKLPAAEAGVHPLEGPNMPDSASPEGQFMTSTVWLMVDDIEAARQQLAEAGVEVGEAHNEGWGISTSFALPSGARLGLYQPLHPVALDL